MPSRRSTRLQPARIMLPSWISWLIKNNAIKATVSDDTVAFLLYWCGMENGKPCGPFSIFNPQLFSGGVIATFMTPSRRFSKQIVRR